MSTSVVNADIHCPYCQPLLFPIGASTMLLDPLVLSHGMTFAATGGVASNWRRTAIGKYVSVDGSFSSDQPSRLWITPQVVLQGPSSYRFRLEADKNVAPVNGIQQKDDTLRCDINLSGNLRSFNSSDMVFLVNDLAWLVGTNMSRIISGES